MRRICDADYVYRPWGAARRQAASDAALRRIYGSVEKARRAQAKKLRKLLAERTKLKKRLGSIESSIRWCEKRLIGLNA